MVFLKFWAIFRFKSLLCKGVERVDDTFSIYINKKEAWEALNVYLIN